MVSFKKIKILLINITFILFLVFPMVVELLYLKFALLLVLATVGFFSLNTYNKKLFYNFLLYVFMGLILMWYGYIRGTPGWDKLGLLLTFWPVLYFFSFSNLKQESINNALYLTTLLVVLYTISQFLYFVFYLEPLRFFDSEIVGVGFYDGFFEFTAFQLNTFPFLLAFSFGSYFFLKQKRWLILYIALAILSFISLRKGLILANFLLVFFYRKEIVSILNIKLKIFFFLIFICSVIIFYNTNFINEIITGFNFQNNINDSNSARVEQFISLMKGFFDSPFFGHGLGSSAEAYGSVRSPEEPWSYELFFVAMLFQIGLIPYLILALIISLFYFKLNKLFQGVWFIVFVVGFTNPTFFRFDGFLFLFLAFNYLKYKHV